MAQGRTYLHSTKDVNCEEPRREFPLGEIIVLNRGEGALDHNRVVEQHTQPCNLGRVEPSTPVQATPSQHTREPLPSPRCPTPAYFRPLHGQSVLRAQNSAGNPEQRRGERWAEVRPGGVRVRTRSSPAEIAPTPSPRCHPAFSGLATQPSLPPFPII